MAKHTLRSLFRSIGAAVLSDDPEAEFEKLGTELRDEARKDLESGDKPPALAKTIDTTGEAAPDPAQPESNKP